MNNPEEKILFTGKSRKGRSLVFRYPLESDVEDMWRYINALSKEKTFIHLQGEEVTLDEEKRFVTSQIEKIKEHKAVLLPAFSDQKLVGISGIELNGNTEKHIGILGISVAKEFRGEGIGSLLLKHVIELAIDHIKGLEIISLQVFSHNTLGRDMYKRYGFKEYAYLPKGVKLENSYHDQILMYKNVNKHIPT